MYRSNIKQLFLIISCLYTYLDLIAWNEFVGLFVLFQKCQTLLALWYAAFRVGIPVWILMLRVSFSGNCYCFQIGRQHGIIKGLQILVLDSHTMHETWLVVLRAGQGPVLL